MLKHILEILESTPAKLVAEVAPLRDTELRTGPRPDCWWVLEVVAHLEDVGEVAMRSRACAFHDLGHLKQILEIKR
jgi:hypothetical protein